MVDVVLDILDAEMYNVVKCVDTKRVHVYSQRINSIFAGREMGRPLPKTLKKQVQLV